MKVISNSDLNWSKIKTKLFLLIFPICFFVASCINDEEDIVQTKDYFPSKTGNYWIYSVVDSFTSKVEIVKVRVIETKRLTSGETLSKWEYSSATKADTDFIFIKLDTILFYDDAALT
ncbi:MAG: hypothetical protein N3A61_02675, partial [Ignavibacteria bacterium]|nr:hypothetical protein [Ignavibacteria bacterium]